MKGLLKGSMQGIGMAAFLFIITSMINDLAEGGRFVLENYQMTRMVIGCIICGIGWGAPSVVYNKEGLSLPMKRLIHMGIGCVVYTIVAFYVGWLGTNTSLGQKIMIIAIQIAIAIAIWFGFHLYYKNEAKKMNERIHEMK